MATRDDDLYVSRMLTAPGVFTAGAEGPACDAAGNIYAVNFGREGTIGRVTPEGEGRVWLELPLGSVGNGIRFDRGGDMLIADYTNHNILRVDMETSTVSVYAHEPALNQPNDLTIDLDDTLFASDPNWNEGTGQFWRIGEDRTFVRMEASMSTTNGIEIDVQRRLLYVNETATRRIWVYDLPLGGLPTTKRLLTEFPDFALDGMRLDRAGNLFVARWSKGTVAMVSPTGDLMREIPVSGKSCTNVAFGGADGRTCYVTVADSGAIDEFRTEHPGQSWWLRQPGVLDRLSAGAASVNRH
ncbi:MAG: SMP-30/gluconolactonase/LRE family protein [Chloroflexota bacterium]|nr:SMP-30/gluconolactonase/LRE family protein [Chloroflexota bacterium]